MKINGFQIILAIIFMISGSINTISAKWMNRIMVIGIDGVERKFVHPLLKIEILFIGEILCMITFSIVYGVLKRRMDGSTEENIITKGSRYYDPLILWPPALLNMIANSLMLFGLVLTNESSFQMISSSVLIFTALLSICVFKRAIKIHEWIGIVLIILGMVTIGLGDIYQTSEPNEQAKDEFLGNILISIGQLFSGGQFVYEEVVVKRLDIPPLQMVGWEGIFGFIVLTIFLFPLNFFPLSEKWYGLNASNTMEDTPDAVIQIVNEPIIFIPLLFSMLSIAVYKFAGVFLTKELSATTRIVFDSFRIILVWAFSIAISWQGFHLIQIVGFIALVLGICIYNDIYVTKASSCMKTN